MPNKQPKRKTVAATPAVLPRRPEQKHTRYSSTGNFTGTLDAVALTISTTNKENEYSLPELEGDVYRTLRQYGLVLARYQIANPDKFTKRYKFNRKVINTANRVVANYLFRNIYDDDPTLGTVHLLPLQSALGVPQPSADAIMATQAYIGTRAFTDLVNPSVIKDPAVLEALGWAFSNIDSMLWDEAKPITYHLRTLAKCINSPDKRTQRRALGVYEHICMWLASSSRRVDDIRARNKQDQAQREASKKEAKKSAHKQDRRGGKPIESKVMSGWEVAILSKPELTVSHTGLIGRRIVAAREGKYVRDLGRIISDPEQRIFGRKTKALGGVVVVDCSGSMSLTDNEMKQIMQSSAGCTVVAYSSGGTGCEGEPNIWLVARRGRQVRHLPEYPGGNGVDGPALEYGLSFRTHNAPVVWISDTQVTGASGHTNEKLQDFCLRYCRVNNIHIVNNCKEAIALLTKLQRGERVIVNNQRSDNE